MYARDTGAEERQLLYLVPDGDEPEGGEPELKVLPRSPKRNYGAMLVNGLKARAAAIVALALMIAVVAMPHFAAHASTAITIDTDVLFGSVNDWISTFLPIFAIGLGIAIALAIIAIVGDSILMGLRRGVR